MPDIFRLLNSEGSDLLDSISGDYEDSFSLEQFEDICHSHWKVNKAFIIARVQTVDPKQPDKEFYSYYDAFCLNKILYQTQVVLKKRYIHRLHVLNPLTNTDIIGNVHYFLLNQKSSFESLPDARSPKLKDMDGFDDVVSPSVKAIEKGEKFNWTMKNHRVREENSDSQNCTLEKFAAPLAAKNDRLHLPIEQVFPLNPKSAAKKRHSLTLTAFFPLEQPHVNECQRSEISPGTVTQFSTPIASDKLSIVIPQITSGNRRALSYRNAVSASSIPVSFLEWSNIIEKENEMGLNNPEFYDELDISLILPAAKASKKESETSKNLIYNGLLFATDDDYLSSSKIRKVFLENALTPEDAKLFEMKEYTGTVEEGGEEGRQAQTEERVRRPRTDISICSIQ